MRTSRAREKNRTGLALAGAAAVVAAAFAGAGAVGAATAPHGSTAIRLGAGPGWPKRLHASDFVARVDNPWWPLKPGSRWHYRGVDTDGHFTDDVRVTHRIKKIEGVRATVVHDVVSRHGKPREITNDFYAQDRHRNVWYFGENTRELNRHGQVTSREGSFLSGRHGARPGVLIPGHPRVGQTSRQEYLKGHAEDHMKILGRRARVWVPYVASRHAVKTKEWSPLEPNVVDHKYYVRGVGDVKEFTAKGPKEILRLVAFHRG
jgi:hypothetical protein